jgi:cell division inhibitor SepF
VQASQEEGVMGALRKTLVYLGLAEDERYDDYEVEEREQEQDRRPVRVRDEEPRTGATVTHLPSAVRAAGDLQRITAVHPRTYNDAKIIGEHFREGVPVIMNLSEMTDVEAKRLVDFAAGLVFGLHGAVERVTTKVFLLSPSAVEVTNEKHEITTGAGLFNQS